MPPRVRAPALSPAMADASPRSVSRTAPFARNFSSTPCQLKMSKGRRIMFRYLTSNQGRAFAEGSSGPKYIGPFSDQPFPMNPLFRSQPVLDDETKDLIYEKIVTSGEPIKAVSAEIGVDARRIAAVVRLKQIEKQWQEEGKKMAWPYAKAVMSMLPKTTYRPGEENHPHEPINEISVHPWTQQQLFVPTSESRDFTRDDAAKAFNEELLSADERSPHKLLIQMEKEVLQGKTRKQGMENFRKAAQDEEDALAKKLLKEREREVSNTTKYKTDRFEFRIKKINAESVGADGKSVKGTGWRYGVPFDDRKRMVVKIPTSMP